MDRKEILRRLHSAGLTILALSSEMGVSNVSITQVISGRSESRRIKRKIAEILNLTEEEIWVDCNTLIKDGDMSPKNIKQKIKEAKMSLTSIGNELGVSVSTVSQVVSGRTKSRRIREKIAVSIGMQVEKIWIDN